MTLLTSRSFLFFSILSLCLPIIPTPVFSQTLNREGWAVPDLKGLIPYSITVRKADGVEKVVEKFNASDGGHVAKISGNGKVFAYAVDSDREPPIDLLVLDPDGLGKFTHKFGADDFYSIPEWVSQ